MWSPFVLEELRNIKPDIVVSDFFSRPGTMAADELGIPVVINVPGSLEFMDNYGLLRLVSPEHSTAFCGILCYG